MRLGQINSRETSSKFGIATNISQTVIDEEHSLILIEIQCRCGRQNVGLLAKFPILRS